MKKPFYKRPLFFWIVAVPNVFSMVYFAGVAAPEYVSRSSIVVYQPHQHRATMTLQLSQSGSESLEGDYILSHYIHSWTGFQAQKEKHLADIFSQGDFVSRFGGLMNGFSTNQTVLWKYYRHHVRITIDKKSGIMELSTISYSPEGSYRLNRSVLQAGQSAINALNTQALHKAEAFDEKVVEAAKHRLHQTIDALSSYQVQHHIVSPDIAYTSKMSLLNSLMIKKAIILAHMQVIEGAAPRSHQIVNLQASAEAIQSEIRHIQASTDGVSGLTKGYGTYTYKQNAVQVAENLVKAAYSQLTVAQQSAIQHQYYIENISGPSLPPDPTLPHRIEWIGWTLLITSILFLVIK